MVCVSVCREMWQCGDSWAMWTDITSSLVSYMLFSPPCEAEAENCLTTALTSLFFNPWYENKDVFQ